MPCQSCPCPVPLECRATPALCSLASSDEPVFVRHVKDVACGMTAIPSPDYPPLATQAGNALSALGRVVANAVIGQPVVVSAEEQARRLAICASCPEYDAEQARCQICGCYARFKARLASEHCPLESPKW
jgi:hypothetical protein